MLKSILGALVALGVSIATLISGNVAPEQNAVSNQICLLQPPAPTTCLPVENAELVNPYLLEEMSENRNDPTHCPTNPYYLAYLSRDFECMPGNIECLSSAILEDKRSKDFLSGSMFLSGDKYFDDYTIRVHELTNFCYSSKGKKIVHDADRHVLNQTLSEQCRIAGQPFKWNQIFHDNFNGGTMVKTKSGGYK